MENALPIILGAIIIVIGIVNMKGDIRSLHKYHRSRVAPENIKAYGRLIGLGTVLNGVGCVLFGIFNLIGTLNSVNFLSVVGSVLMILGITAGLVIIIVAMLKYNKGVF